MLRDSGGNSARNRPGKLIPASDTTTLLSEKQPDMTVLYQLKGSSPPSSTTVFHETLTAAPGSEQEWHWAIVQAKGVPSQKPVASEPGTSGVAQTKSGADQPSASDH
jgi:hypothetical protein